jgi:uroporphyrinogen-III synthase
MDFSSKMSELLVGCGVWITRPDHLAEGLYEAIEIYGGKPLLYPTLVIASCSIDEKDWQVFSHVQQVIVTSQTALQQAPKSLLCSFISNQERLKILAIGSATADFLTHLGLRVDYVPSIVGSEYLLLEAPTLQNIAHQSIAILTGKEGLPVLDEGLSARGATIVRLETYERQVPSCFQDWEKWQNNCQAITLGSVVALDNAYACLPNREAKEWLQGLTGFVGSQRILDEVRARYPNQVFLQAKSPHDADMVEALKFWWHTR